MISCRHIHTLINEAVSSLRDGGNSNAHALRIKKSTLILTAIFLFMCFVPTSAHAQCTNNMDGNAGVDGEMEFFTTDDELYYCDNTDWIPMRWHPDGTRSLIAHWRLDETTGTAIADSVGNNDGTWTETGFDDVSNDAGPGILGGSIDFSDDGQIDAGSNPEVDNLYVKDGLTVCAWVNPTNIGSPGSSIIQKISFPAGWDFYMNSSGGGWGFINNLQGDISANTPWVSQISQHLCATWDGSDGASGMALAGDGGAGCSSPTGAAGDMVYNDDNDVMQFCEGDDWVAIGK